MKWGVRKDKRKYDTSFRPTSTYKNGKLATVDHIAVNYKNKHHRKAARAAYRAGYRFKGSTKDRLSVMGNEFVKSLKDQKISIIDNNTKYSGKDYDVKKPKSDANVDKIKNIIKKYDPKKYSN